MSQIAEARPSALTSQRARGISTRRLISRIVLYVVVIFLAAIFTAPMLWTIGLSLKAPEELSQFPPSIFPAVPQFQNYVEIFTSPGIPFGLFLWNSVFVTTLAIIGEVVTATLVAYGFSRFRFPGRDFLFVVLLSTLLLPREVTIVPSYLLFRQLHWLDTFAPLIVPSYFGGGAFNIFLLRQFFLTLPKEMDEAAKVDGAGSLRILFQILLPLAMPAIATVAIFSFLGHWQDFFNPLIYLNSTDKFTASLGLRFFQTTPFEGRPKDHLLAAGSLILAAPCIMVFFMAQRIFVKGIVMTGIKG